MLSQQLNYFTKELKSENGKRWVCESCVNSEVKSTEKQQKKKLDTEAELDENSSKQYTLNDVMVTINGVKTKLFEIDINYIDLMTKYKEHINVSVQTENTNIRVFGLGKGV